MIMYDDVMGDDISDIQVRICELLIDIGKNYLELAKSYTEDKLNGIPHISECKQKSKEYYDEAGKILLKVNKDIEESLIESKENFDD